jgi:hypothetical protein
MPLMLLAAGCAFAQVPPNPSVTTPVTAGKAASPKVVMIKPGGAKATVAGPVTFEQKTEWVQRDESASDFLGKNGLAADNRTIKAFRTLNPQVQANGTIPAGSKVSIFVPTPGTSAASDANASKASVDMALVAKYSLGGEVAKSREIRMQTLQLPASAYAKPADFSAHRALVTDIDKAAVLVNQRADQMSARDLALSKYYLANANRQASGMANMAKVSAVPSAQINQLQTAVAPVQNMQMRLSTGGSPFEYRPVVVSVSAKEAGQNPPPLRVYVLPGGFIDDPETFDEGLLKQLLVQLTFQSLTSPAKSSVAQGDMRVWIGPDHAYEGMARMVRERKLNRFTPLHITSAGSPDVELKFVTPDDIVRP